MCAPPHVPVLMYEGADDLVHAHALPKKTENSSKLNIEANLYYACVHFFLSYSFSLQNPNNEWNTLLTYCLVTKFYSQNSGM